MRSEYEWTERGATQIEKEQPRIRTMQSAVSACLLHAWRWAGVKVKHLPPRLERQRLPAAPVAVREWESEPLQNLSHLQVPSSHYHYQSLSERARPSCNHEYSVGRPEFLSLQRPKRPSRADVLLSRKRAATCWLRFQFEVNYLLGFGVERFCLLFGTQSWAMICFFSKTRARKLNYKFYVTNKTIFNKNRWSYHIFIALI